MASTQRLGEWFRLGDGMCRLWDFDDLSWELGAPLPALHIAASSFGGLIAVVLKQAGSNVSLFTSTGRPMGSSFMIPMEESEKVMFMCWNDTKDHLIIVLTSGVVKFFNSKADMVATPISVTGPTMCTSTGNGVAIITDSYKAIILECEDSGEYRPRTADIMGISERPSCVLAIPAALSDNGYCELFIAPTVPPERASTLHHAVFQSNRPRCYVMKKPQFEGGSIVRMALSPAAKKIALITEMGRVYVTNSELEEDRFFFETGTDITPTQLMWCGEKAFAYCLLSRQFAPEDEFITTITLCDAEDPDTTDEITSVPSDLLMVLECDGIRILSGDQYQMLQAVPDGAARAFRVGSTAAAALLVTAYDQYVSENAASIKIVRELTSNTERLSEAIDDCIVAAGFEFDPQQQRRLLRIAAFGKSFCSSYETENFVNMTRRLRVMHSVRQPEVGMCVSVKQLATLEGDRLTERLVAHRHYELAFCICKQLSLKIDQVMLSWATSKINSSMPEKDIAASIVRKFSECPGISYAFVASAAHQRGKNKLASLLLESESSADSQIPMLLEINETDIALKKAIDSGNANLLFLVMMNLVGNRGAGAVNILSRDPQARDMLVGYALACESRRELLTEYYHSNPKYFTYLSLQQHLKEHEKLVKLLAKRKDGWEMLQECRISTAQSAEETARREPDGKLTEKLLRLQQQLLDEQTSFAQQTKNVEFLTASVSDTIRLCFQHNFADKAEILKKRFNVPEKMFQWAQLRALCNIGDWPGIDKMGGNAGSRAKPAIGPVPFVKMLAEYKRPEQGKQFIPKVSRIEERMELYLICEAWQEAAADCRKNGEDGILDQLRERARGNTRALDLIERGVTMKAAESGGFSSLFK